MSCGVTKERLAMKALARAARARLMVARGDAPARMRFFNPVSTLAGKRVVWTSSTMYFLTAGSM